METKICRLVNTDQIIGIVFLKLYNEGIKSIEISKIGELFANLDIELKKENKSIVVFDTRELQSFKESYSELFCFKDELIMIRDDISNKQDILEFLNYYFYDGTPEDIRDTIIKTINKTIF